MGIGIPTPIARQEAAARVGTTPEATGRIYNLIGIPIMFPARKLRWPTNWRIAFRELQLTIRRHHRAKLLVSACTHPSRESHSVSPSFHTIPDVFVHHGAFESLDVNLPGAMSGSLHQAIAIGKPFDELVPAQLVDINIPANSLLLL